MLYFLNSFQLNDSEDAQEASNLLCRSEPVFTCTVVKPEPKKQILEMVSLQ